MAGIPAVNYQRRDNPTGRSIFQPSEMPNTFYPENTKDQTDAGAPGTRNLAMAIWAAKRLPEGQKFDDAMIEREQVLRVAASDYAANYIGGFSYMLDMAAQVLRPRGLSTAQARGTLNCLLAQVRREVAQAADAQAEKETFKDGGEPIKDGTYTVVADDGDYVTLRIRSQGEASKFAGKQIAEFLNGPENSSDFMGFAFIQGRRPMIWKRFQDDSRISKALRALVSTSEAELKELGYQYALRSSRCYRCGHVLTVPASIHRGLGPVCAGLE